MKQKSASVLDEAGHQQRIIDFILFTTDQNARLWDAEGTEGCWIPGYPIHKKPIYKISDDGERVLNLGNEWGFTTTCVRWMFEEFDDGERYEAMRCKDCEVSWSGPHPCFVCGQVQRTAYDKIFFFSPHPNFDSSAYRSPVRRIDSITEDDRGLAVQFTLHDEMTAEITRHMEAMSVSFGMMFESARENSRFFIDFFESFRGLDRDRWEAANQILGPRTLRGARFDFAVLDEAQQEESADFVEVGGIRYPAEFSLDAIQNRVGAFTVDSSSIRQHLAEFNGPAVYPDRLIATESRRRR